MSNASSRVRCTLTLPVVVQPGHALHTIHSRAPKLGSFIRADEGDLWSDKKMDSALITHLVAFGLPRLAVARLVIRWEARRSHHPQLRPVIPIVPDDELDFTFDNTAASSSSFPMCRAACTRLWQLRARSRDQWDWRPAHRDTKSKKRGTHVTTKKLPLYTYSRSNRVHPGWWPLFIVSPGNT